MKKIKCVTHSTRPLRVMGVGYVAAGDIIEVPDDVAQSLCESGDFIPAKNVKKKEKSHE